MESLDNVTYPFVCDLELILPNSTIPSVNGGISSDASSNSSSNSSNMATDLMRILSVDAEVGDRVVKTFSVGNNDNEGNNFANVLKVHFAATEAKLLRVSVSSFTEYLNVALHCHQEFCVESLEQSQSPHSTLQPPAPQE
jgi:Transcription factor Pcc1